ncbi:methionine aminopeptidase [Halalkalibacter alkaliphilus]|uniref:Methionine aminopeptidase n=1 Tax=Halalkalibacter alkaliphilus TaxID=2917993 RepID=A0A9X2CWX1_9BACI|nr:methionine aminopeptidase [Halalkalibacter alkaliphilus]MCL7749788.1 methionine aminopeptidase [Halalkalibacter alkaliphilus]
MGIMNVFGDWIEKRNERRIELCKSQGICPECQGKGFNLLGTEVYMVNSSYYHCAGCNGSGSYFDWVKTI